MKKIKIFLTSIAVIIGILISCNESDIELNNPNEIATDSFFKSSIHLESAATACYTFLQDTGNYARYQFYINDNIGGENRRGANLEADKVQMIQRDVDEANNGNMQYWQHNYQGIGRCNFVVENEENFENIPTAEISQRLGEVRFLRGLFYFNLVTKYGEIPIVLDLDNVVGGRPKSSVEEVYNVIIADLQFATDNLPEKDEQEIGRPTPEAAWSLLGRVLLQKGDAAGAKDALSNVTDADYSLMDNYGDNFTVEGEYNRESIFEVNFDESTGAGDSWDQNGRGNSETSFRAMEYSGWVNVKPSQELLDEYEDGDTRYADTFYSIDGSDNGTFTNTYNKGKITFVSDGFGAGNVPAWRKYQNLDNRAEETMFSGINARVIRYADVLLMKAEAEIRSGGTEADALAFLNQVRARPSVNMAPVNVVGTAAILEAIKHERWVELAGEQSRWLDLKRFDGDTYLLPIPNIELQGNINL